MAKTSSQNDVEFIKALAELLEQNDLAEIEVERAYGEDDSLAVRVTRTLPQQAAPMMQYAPAPAAAPAAAPAPAAAAPAAPEAADDPAAHPGAVTSPMVGTVYMQAEPGAAPFISVGAQVSQGQTLIIVEAMKTMNHIPAPKSGMVKRVLVDNGDAVEFGTPLVIVE
ncbi:MAG: acetyl-CoA carboxylase biotin carboxyl carrier protein [Paracoccaceae bacterium]